MRHGRDVDLTPGAARRQGRLLRRLVPRRLRHDPGRPRRPAGGRRPPLAAYLAGPDCRRRGTSSTCAGCAAATRPPMRWPRRSARARSTEGWTLDVEREDVCPVVTFPEGVDIEGYLATLGKKERHEIRRKVRRAEAVGEIAPRATRPTRSPTSRRSSTSTRSAGAPTACSRRRPAARRAGSSSGACSSCSGRTGRCACASCRSAAGGSRPASTSRRRTASSTTTPASTRTRATCRRAC